VCAVLLPGDSVDTLRRLSLLLCVATQATRISGEFSVVASEK
jgi:hypothetical protein